MSDASKTADTPSAWTLEVDLEKGQVRRVRNFSRKTGVPPLPLEKKLRDLFMGLAGMIELSGETFSSTVLENKAAELSYGWARVAQEQEKVRIFLTWMVTTNAWTDAIAPSLIVVGAVAWRFEVLPDGFIAGMGEKAAKFSGALPLTPEEEAAIMEQGEQLAKFMAEQDNHEDMEPEPHPEPQEPAETEPESDDEPPPINGGGPQIVSLPPDADLD